MQVIFSLFRWLADSLSRLQVTKTARECYTRGRRTQKDNAGLFLRQSAVIQLGQLPEVIPARADVLPGEQ